MATVEVQVVFPYVSNMPEDVSINTFWFTTPDLDLATLVLIYNALDEFYNVTPPTPGVDPLGNRLSAYISRVADACEMRFYDPTVPGPPLHVEPFTLVNATATSSLPFEVAICCSFAGSDVGVPTRRQRGRIYLGPLVIDVIDAPANAPSRPDQDTRNTAMSAMARLITEPALTGNGVAWVVHSRGKYSTGTVPPNDHVIDHCWVDNEWDTQRRRQTKPTSRIVFP